MTMREPTALALCLNPNQSMPVPL
uniref:Uncharacterized protein n=1 Tax=Anguilla anguilla TaxID=7936 RepID=A0A0E9W493_ANGAN